MHRLILDAPAGMLVDHINGNGLDNRRGNLRLATKAQNVRNRKKNINNTSGFKGVTWDINRLIWKARIKVGREIYLGCFATPEEAHGAYCTAAAKYHGEFARTA